MLSHISHSSITAADDCLKKFQLSKLSPDPVPEFPSGPRDIGTLAHSYIEAFFRGESYLSKLVEADHTTHHAEAMAIFEGWRRRFTIQEEQWLYSEREGHATVEGVPDILGYDDFVYQDGGSTVLRDFKTGWGTEVYDSYDFQGDLACLRYEQEFGVADLASEVEFVRRGIVSPRRLWSPALRDATIDRVKAVWAKIQQAEINSTWAATPGKHCTFCTFSANCAKGRAALAAGLVISDEQGAVSALKDLSLMAEAEEVLKAALRAYVDANGTVVAGAGKYDYVARFNESQSITCTDPGAVVTVVGLEKMGKALKIDTKVKDGQRLLNDTSLAGFFKAGKTTTRFYVGKNKNADEEE